jgi:hypothetical protein
MAKRKATMTEDATPETEAPQAPVVDEKLISVGNACIPVYHMTRGRDAANAPAEEQYAGKIIHLVQPEENTSREGLAAAIGDRDELLEALTDRDVLWVPLYQSHTNKRMETWPVGAPDHYELAFDLLKLAAPRVAAIMIGNMGCELCWFHRSKTFCERVLPFVRDTALLVRDCGGRPAYGTVDWDILVDCYRGGGQMADVMREVDALQICYCGYTLAADGHYDRAHNLYADQNGFIGRHDKDRGKLRAYLASVDAWSGMNFVSGLVAGNDRACADLGFRAGMIG